MEKFICLSKYFPSFNSFSSYILKYSKNSNLIPDEVYRSLINCFSISCLLNFFTGVALLSFFLFRTISTLLLLFFFFCH